MQLAVKSGLTQLCLIINVSGIEARIYCSALYLSTLKQDLTVAINNTLYQHGLPCCYVHLHRVVNSRWLAIAWETSQSRN